MTRRTHSTWMLLPFLTLAAGQAAAITCPPDAVPVGPVCIDKYEASVWSIPDPTTTHAELVSKIKAGTVTLEELQDPEVGATQLGCTAEALFNWDHDPFPSNFPENGNWSSPPTPGVYAVSVELALPSACITWFQAAQACRLSDKRLPTNAEWQDAAAGTPDPGTDNGSSDCKTGGTGEAVPTGSRGACVSNWGASDMVGNVAEWVADWGTQPSGDCPGWGTFSDDVMCWRGTSTTALAPSAPFRGGWFQQGSGAGVFAVNAKHPPHTWFAYLGFRCAR
jgi:formylglycine-generating enzyme required for sulfatase activity